MNFVKCLNSKYLTKPIRTKLIFLLSVFTLSLFPQSVQSQEIIEKLARIFEFDIGKERPDSTFRHTKAVFAPVVTFEPSTSWGFGVGAKFLFKPFGAGADTRTSNIPLSIQYTLENQFIAESEFTIFLPREEYLIKGNLDFSKFPIAYFGIGSTTKDDDQIDISYDNLLFEPLFLKQVLPSFFLGGGWRFNTYRQVELLEENEAFPLEISPQDSLGSTSSGIELAATLDSRNNVLNAGSGAFGEFTHGVYREAIGSTSSFMLTKLDLRKYWTFNKDRPYDVLAVQFLTRLSWGDTPVLELSSLGGADVLRGFREVRFRDRFSFFSQVEYRWQALDRIGFTFFGGVGDVFDNISNLELGNLKYSLGSGLRVKIIKSENLNVRIDFALGLGPTTDQNFYIGIAEAF